jgi:hypothetical protein
LVLQCNDAYRIEAIDPLGASGMANDEPSVLQHFEVLRDCWLAYWQDARQLAHSHGLFAQTIED